MVTQLLQQAPYWTAMRCRLLFWAADGDDVILDAVMSAEQPDGEWATPAGTPFTVVIAVPSMHWLDSARELLERWVMEEREVEIRRTRAWEDASQVLVWGPDASLLVILTR